MTVGMERWRWLWWCATVVTQCVGAAVVVRRWLVPWTRWLARRAACWCRYALESRGPRRRDRDRGPGPATCRCCGGVDFDGMAGAWAVVTGCTDGIGKEYALQLADRGLHVALVSRNPSKLQAVAKEIHERNDGRIKTRIVTADFTSSGSTVSLADSYDAVRRGLTGLDIKLLVNNAGLAYGPEELLNLPPCCSRQHVDGESTTAAAHITGDPCRDVVECNALAAVAMCRIVMPLMLDRGARTGADNDDVKGTGHGDPEDRDDGKSLLWPSAPSTVRGGVVINVSSISALLPAPQITVYAATKAFLNKFSADLAVECGQEWRRRPAIAVRCLTPGFVATKLSRLRVGTDRDIGWAYVPGPRSYARRSLRSLGCHCACRELRGLGDERGNARNAAAGGWLTGFIDAAMISPSSPIAVGPAGIATTGYPAHTLMVWALNATCWLVGDAYVYSAINQMMRRIRDRRIASKSKVTSAT